MVKNQINDKIPFPAAFKLDRLFDYKQQKNQYEVL